MVADEATLVERVTVSEHFMVVEYVPLRPPERQDGGGLDFRPGGPSLNLHLPDGRWPAAYGIDGHPVPEGYWRQLAWPFRP